MCVYSFTVRVFVHAGTIHSYWPICGVWGSVRHLSRLHHDECTVVFKKKLIAPGLSTRPSHGPFSVRGRSVPAVSVSRVSTVSATDDEAGTAAAAAAPDERSDMDVVDARCRSAADERSTIHCDITNRRSAFPRGLLPWQCGDAADMPGCGNWTQSKIAR